MPHRYASLLILLLAASGAAAQPFHLVQDQQGLGAYRAAAAWADIGRDGDFDVLLTGNIGEEAAASYLFRHLGGGFFLPQNAQEVLPKQTPDGPDVLAPIDGLEFSSLDVGDVDRDGDLDVLVTGRRSGSFPTTRLYLVALNAPETMETPLGDWKAIRATATFPGVEHGDARFGDYDGDGDLDVLLTGSFITRVYRNDGPGPGSDPTLVPRPWRYTDAEAGLTGLAYSSALWADLDGDGDLDIVTMGSSLHPPRFVTRLYRNDGPDDGGWRFSPIEADLHGLAYGDVAAGDADDDGDVDLLLTGCTDEDCARGRTLLYRNDSNGPDAVRFTEVDPGLPGLFRSSISWGDVDNDGDLDILLAGEDPARRGTALTRIYRNEPGTDSGADARTFVDLEAGLPGVAGGAVRWADYDGDGDLDLFLSGYDYASASFTTAMYRNDRTGPANTRPEPPSGLVAVQDGTTVTFRWNPASDAETPTDGLTYNVYVGTGRSFDTFSDVLPSHSHPPSGMAGARLVAGPGNAGHRTELTLERLVPGQTYYWSVQTVDHGYAASAFAPDQLLALPGIDPDFLARLNVRDDVNRSTTLTFGTHPAATDDYDPAFDVMTPPSSDQSGFEGYFLLPTGFQLQTDVRAFGDRVIVWDLRAVVSRIGGFPMTFAWDPAALPAGGTFRLTDDAGRVDVDMHQERTLQYLFGSTLLLQIVYTPSTVNPQAPTGVEDAPAAFALQGTYPNPAADATHLLLDLPAPADVRVDVYDVLGRHVLGMPWQTLSAGPTRSLRLDTAALTPGTYLYRVHVRDGTPGLHTATGHLTLVP